jgi:hypothetical protein
VLRREAARPSPPSLWKFARCRVWGMADCRSGSGRCSKVRNGESVRPRLRTESAVAVLACTDPTEQESVVLLPELDRLVG